MTDNLPAEIKPDQTQDKDMILIENLPLYSSWAEAGIASGYSESYSKTKLKSYKLNSHKFLDKLAKYYQSGSRALLPKILAAESKVVDAVLADPEKISKFRHTLKEIKQSAGVLRTDDSPRPMMINVKAVQNILKVIQNADDNRNSEAIDL